MLDRVGDRLGGALQRKLVAKEARDARRIALRRGDRLAEFAAAATADAEHVDLLLGEAADPHRDLLARHADLHDASRGRDRVDHRAHRGRRAGRVDDDGRTAAPGPVARGGGHLAGARPRDPVRAELASQLEAGLLEVDEQDLRPALAREQRDALADRPGPGDDDLLARFYARTVHGPHRHRQGLGHRGDRGVRDIDRVDLCLPDPQLLLQAAVLVDADQREVVAGVRAPDAARIAVPAGVQRVERDALADDELGTAAGSERLDRRADLVALDAGERRAARRL